ncbi:MAG TPA: ATP-binding protein [Ktedonobacteraceae bacterium]
MPEESSQDFDIRQEADNALVRYNEINTTMSSQDFDIQQEADRLLLATYAPASVVVDANMEILHVRGRTSPYLELAAGESSLNLLNMARNNLGPSLRSAIRAARKANQAVTKEILQVSEAGTRQRVQVKVTPLKGPSAQYYFLVLFEERPPLARPGPADSPSGEPADHATRRGAAARRIAALEQELASMRAEMAGLLEELQNANEETLASNEELQNANEELKAINEELSTTNQQLEVRNEQFKEAQEYAEAIVETVSEPLLVLSAELRVERANSAFYQFFRVEPPRIEGRSLYSLGRGQWNRPRLRTLLEEVLTTNRSFKDFEVEYDFSTIGHKIMLLNARRIVREGEPIRDHQILLMMEDITERRELERQRDDIIDMVSHELRTPLYSAKLYTDQLKEGLAEVGNELAKVDAQLDELSRLINDLLDATSLGAGILQMHSAPFLVDDLVQSVVEEMGHIHSAARLLLQGEAHVEAYGDRERIRQVLINLISNAIKYSLQTEPVYVSISVDTDTVTVSVQDRGMGIPLERQARIFERFYHASEQKQELKSSIGLGLYIASKIVKQQGGQIWVKSEPGKGSTFSFTIPRRKS